MKLTHNQPIKLEREFFLGGHATFTIDNGGQHFTFKVKKWKKNERYYIHVLTGPDNENSYSYLAELKTDGSVVATQGTKISPDAPSYRTIVWLMKHVFGDRMLPEGYRLQHMGHCGRCGRTLTHPESLECGIGPECRSIMGLR